MLLLRQENRVQRTATKLLSQLYARKIIPSNYGSYTIKVNLVICFTLRFTIACCHNAINYTPDITTI